MAIGPVIGEFPDPNGTYFYKAYDVELCTEGGTIGLRQLVLMYDRLTAYREALALQDDEAAEAAMHKLIVAHKDAQRHRGLVVEPIVTDGNASWPIDEELEAMREKFRQEMRGNNEPNEDNEEAEDDASEV